MCELNGSFAKLTNRTLERSNHLFGRRFWCELIKTTSTCSKPADTSVLNPERAGAIDDARRWRWSSLAATLGYVRAARFPGDRASSSSCSDATRCRRASASPAFIQDGRDL